MLARFPTFVRASVPQVARANPVYPNSQRRKFTTPTSVVKMPATEETASYRLNHTMFRIKDPKKSLPFYMDIFGFSLIDEHDAGDFKLFFLAYDHQKVSRGEREGILELTWNKGTEDKADFSYHNGNNEPQGFGHIAIAVDDVQACQDRLLKHGVQFKKKLEDGKMRNIAFALDPDGYWIEIVPTKSQKI